MAIPYGSRGGYGKVNADEGYHSPIQFAHLLPLHQAKMVFSNHSPMPRLRGGNWCVESAHGQLTIYVQERPVDGRANDAITRLLAAHFDVPTSRVQLVSGATSRLKRFRVTR
jgi:uncharacterized protein